MATETLITTSKNGSDGKSSARRQRRVKPNVELKATNRGVLVFAGAPGELNIGDVLTVKLTIGNFGEPFDRRGEMVVYAYADVAASKIV